MPAQDEADNLPAVVGALLTVLPRVADRVEVIVVDDGSRDGTGEVAARLAERDARVRVVRHERNRGYGAAVWSGIRAARLDCIFLTDGDGQFDLREVERVAPLARTGDVVVGYRVRRADPVGRRLAGRVWNALVRRLFGLPLRDVNCAFKFARREVFRALEPRSTGAAISVELIAQARQRGHRVTEVPVAHLPRRHGRATGGSLRVALRAFVELVQLYGRMRRSVAAAAGSHADVVGRESAGPLIDRPIGTGYKRTAVHSE